MQQGAPGSPEPKGVCLGACLRALVALLLHDLSIHLKNKGAQQLGIDPAAAAAAAAVAAAHAAAATHAVGTNAVLDYVAFLRHCIRKQQLPSQLQQQDLLDLLRQLLLLQLTSVKDLLLQTGLWKAIISQPPADQQQELQQQQQQQQQQQEQQELQHDALTSAKADIPAAAAADTVAAAASAFAAAADKEIATEAAEETGMCMDS